MNICNEQVMLGTMKKGREGAEANLRIAYSNQKLLCVKCHKEVGHLTKYQAGHVKNPC